MSALATSKRGVTIVCILALAACGDDDSSATTDNADSSVFPSDTRSGAGAPSVVTDAGRTTAQTATDAGINTQTPAVDASAAPGSGNTSMASAATAQLNDAQIASVSLTANQGEVEQNMIAITRARRDDARAFATDMVAMHTAAIARENALSASMMIIPQDNPVTQMLLSMSQQAVQSLNAASDDEFDAIYIRSQVQAHQQVLTLIDSTLLPQAQAQAMKAELTTMRSTVNDHLERVRGLASDADVSL